MQNVQQAARLKQNLEQTKNKLESANAVQLATLTKHNVVGDMLYGTVFNYFALNDLQDNISATSANILSYRLPSYGIFSSRLTTQYWYGVPRNVLFGGLNMDIDHMKQHRTSKTNNAGEETAFTKSIGTRMSAMEHLVPEQMFSTETDSAQGISAVKALAIASQQGQKIWTINQANLELAISKINLGEDTEMDIRNAVNSGKVVTAPEAKINFNGWIGEGYTMLDPQTGAGGYLIAGGGNGGFLQYLSAHSNAFAFALGFLSVLGVASGFAFWPILAVTVGVTLLLLMAIDLDLIEAGCPDGLRALNAALMLGALAFGVLAKEVADAILLGCSGGYTLQPRPPLQ